MDQHQHILHVEDNPDDALLVAMAFRKAGVGARLKLATDGKEAIAALQQSSVGATPACVLLDVKLTDKSGFEVLSWIRSQPHFKQLPVVLLSSSNHPEDVSRAYEHGANSYLVKPHDLHSLVEMAKTIDLYWVRTNTSNAI
jgi:CheY-like chemotaxis protein